MVLFQRELDTLLKWQFEDRYVEEVILDDLCRNSRFQCKSMLSCCYIANHQTAGHKWLVSLGRVIDAA